MSSLNSSFSVIHLQPKEEWYSEISSVVCESVGTDVFLTYFREGENSELDAAVESLQLKTDVNSIDLEFEIKHGLSKAETDNVEFLSLINTSDIVDVSSWKKLTEQNLNTGKTSEKPTPKSKNFFTNFSAQHCRLCKVKVAKSYHGRRKHLLFHLKKDSKITWAYKCLLCKRTTFDHYEMGCHIVRNHKIPADSMKVDVHYSEQNSLFNEEIKKIQAAAFPNIAEKTKPLYRSAFRHYKAACLIKSDSKAFSPSDKGPKKSVVRDKCSSNKMSTSKCSNNVTKNCEKSPNAVKRGRKKKDSTSKIDEKESVQCALCKGTYKNGPVSIRNHVINHLKTDSDVKGPFKCLFCSKTMNNKFEVNRHYARLHALSADQLKLGVHFEDRTANCIAEFNRIQQAAFPNISVNIRSWRKYSSKIKTVCCALCNCKVNVPRVKVHAMKHLATEANVDWVFECLICKTYRSLVRETLQKHVQTTHKIKARIREGEHFFSRVSELEETIVGVYVKAFPSLVKGPKQPGVRKWKYDCKICGKVTQEMEPHCIKHLPDAIGLKWLYQCLLCKYQALRRKSMVLHAVNRHKINYSDVQLDKHYTSRKSEFKNEIANVVQMAFPQDARKKKFRPIITKPEPDRLHCKICGSYVKQLNHSDVHLTEKAGIEWLYRCNLCTEYQSLSHDGVLSHIFRSHKLPSDSIERDVHVISQRAKFKKQIANVRLLAFPKKERETVNKCRVKRNRECKLCEKVITNASNHIIQHLKDRFEITWLYKCLICKNLKTLYEKTAFIHIANVHHLEKTEIQLDVHYKNRKPEYEKQFSEIRSLAFPCKGL